MHAIITDSVDIASSYLHRNDILGRFSVSHKPPSLHSLCMKCHCKNDRCDDSVIEICVFVNYCFLLLSITFSLL